LGTGTENTIVAAFDILKEILIGIKEKA